uniref:FxSxx-COOH system tetratricopeptide repeat protein n=1 Tax=Streptomyces sp. NBC_00998 TaxID=2903712 RepID=UPI002F909028|nr:FxSxx-COOH system tetratricopeptide repeat protein [Streptomyces sp. NBC_00998]
MVAAAAVAAAAASAVVTNYVTDVLPGWAQDPWVVWPVFIVSVLVAAALAVVGRHLDGDGRGPVRLVPLERVLAGGMESLSAPHGDGPVRGRTDELAALRRMLKRPEERLAVLCGVGGVGKTTIASALADIARAEGVRVFWVRWRGQAELAEQMARIALECGLAEERLEEARAGRAGLPDVVWEQLNRAGRWLVVLDNVDEPGAVGPGGEPVAGYRGWVRPGGRGLLLVTSRDGDAAVWGGRAELLRVAPLSPPTGGQVLVDAAPGAGIAQEAERLSVRLGGLPLALHAAGRYLGAPGSRYRTFTAYEEALDGHLATLLGAEDPGAADPEAARKLVRYTWELSLDQLDANGNALARPILRLLSLLAPAPVPVSFLSPAMVTAACGMQATAVTIETAVNGLHTYGLLDTPTPVDGTPAIGQVILHPLVRDITALALRAETPDLDSWHRALTERMTAVVDEAADAGRSGWSISRLIALHALATAELTPDALTAGRILGNLSSSIRQAGHPEQAAILAEQALGFLQPALGNDHAHVLGNRNSLANALQDLGRYQEAADLDQQTLADRERTLGPDHPDTLASRNNYANALRSLGWHQEAADLHQQTLADRERTLGPSHPDTLASRNNLATVLHSLGRYQEAADLHQQTLADRERTLGPDHPDTLASRQNLASVLQELGRYQEAADLDQQTLADRERTLGPDHPDTLASRQNLASILHSFGRYQEAADLHQQTLADRERTLGPSHPHTLTSRQNLAIALQDLGRHQEAVDLHQQSLADSERTLGPDHPHTLIIRNNLATVLHSLGRYQEAADLHQQTLADRERTLGPDHPHTLSSRNNLAIALQELDRYQEAVGLHQQSLADSERTLGPDHPHTLIIRNNLANTLHSLGRYHEAADLHQQTLADRERTLGPDHPHTLSSRRDMARLGMEPPSERAGQWHWRGFRRRRRG